MQRRVLPIAVCLACAGVEPPPERGGGERTSSERVAIERLAIERPAVEGTAVEGTAAELTGTNPFAVFALAPDRQRRFVGRVEQRIAAGGYVYLQVQPAGAAEAVWVASLAATTPEAPRVRVLVVGEAEQFHSPRLQRDFAPLLFGAVRAAPDDVTSILEASAPTAPKGTR